MRLYFLFLLVFIKSIAQETLYGTDNLNNQYYIKNNNTILKKNIKSESQYTNIALGNISNIDITNPLKIVVYYHDFNTAIILDNQLNKIDTVNFFERNIRFATKATANKLWIFNEETHQVELYNYRIKKTELTSENLFQEVPIKFKSDFNHVYVLTKKHTLIAFDSFLNSKVISKEKKITDFDVDNQTVVIKEGSVFYSLYKKEYKKIITLESDKKTSFSIKGDTLFIFDGKQIQSYNVPKFD